jgi:hypothetical protein
LPPQKQNSVAISLGKLAQNLVLSPQESIAMLSSIQEANRETQAKIRADAERNVDFQFGPKIIEKTLNVAGNSGTFPSRHIPSHSSSSAHSSSSLPLSALPPLSAVSSSSVASSFEPLPLHLSTDEAEWFLTYPGKEKEHFELTIEPRSHTGINFLQPIHIEKHLNPNLSDEEFSQRFEKILALASNYALQTILENESYLKRYLCESDPYYLEKIKKVLNASATIVAMEALEKSHWKTLKPNDYKEISAVKFVNIPSTALDFLELDVIQILYGKMVECSTLKKQQDQPNKSEGKLRNLVQKMEEKLGISSNDSILPRSTTSTPFVSQPSVSQPSPAFSPSFSLSDSPNPPISSGDYLSPEGGHSPPAKRRRT